MSEKSDEGDRSMEWSRTDAERLEREGLELFDEFARRYRDDIRAGTPDPRPRSVSRWLTIPRFSYALNALFVVLALTGYVARDHLFPVMPTVHVRDTVVSITEPDGEPIWTRDFETTVEKAALAPWHRRPRQVIVATKLAGRDRETLANWDFRENRVVWTHAVHRDELIPFYPEHLAEPGTKMRCNTFAFADLLGDGDAEIVTAFRHETYFPSCIRTLSRDGETLGTYFNWGYIDEVIGADIDGDGLDEIVASGTNNAKAYQGGTLVVLDADHLSGHAVDEVVARGDEYTDRSLARLVLPAWHPEIMAYFRFERLHATELNWRSSDRTIECKVGLRMANGHHVHVIVRTDPSLRPVKVITPGWILTECRRALDRGDIQTDVTSQRYWMDWLDQHRRSGALASSTT